MCVCVCVCVCVGGGGFSVAFMPKWRVISLSGVNKVF